MAWPKPHKPIRWYFQPGSNSRVTEYEITKEMAPRLGLHIRSSGDSYSVLSIPEYDEFGNSGKYICKSDFKGEEKDKYTASIQLKSKLKLNFMI